MNRLSLAITLTAFGLLAIEPATAQNGCPAGRTLTGQCVNPGLAESQQQAAVIYSQPLISHTHYPVLPALDWIFRYPNQLNPNQLKPSEAGLPSFTVTID
jgi:hypothetical protein